MKWNLSVASKHNSVSTSFHEEVANWLFVQKFEFCFWIYFFIDQPCHGDTYNGGQLSDNYILTQYAQV